MSPRPSSYTPSVLTDWGQAIGGRRNMGIAQFSAGGLGYVSGAMEYLLSPLTGSLDLVSSYYRGRHGWIAPADIETTNISLIGIGGAESMLARVGSLTRVSVAAKRIPQVRLNKAASDAFEADVIANVLPKTQVNIQPQITIKSSGPSGLKVRLDALGEDMTSGATRLSDMKASSTAPFTPNQTVVYPELELYGGIVVGKGKAPYVGGTNIPPTAVDVIRKVNR